MKWNRAMRLPPDERPENEELRALERMGRVKKIRCNGCHADVAENSWHLHVCPWTYLTVEAAEAARASLKGRAA